MADLLVPVGTEQLIVQQPGGDSKVVTVQSIIDLAGGGGGSAVFKGTHASLAIANALSDNAEGDTVTIFEEGGFTFVEGVILDTYVDPSSGNTEGLTSGTPLFASIAAGAATVNVNENFHATLDNGVTFQMYRKTGTTTTFALGSPGTIDTFFDPTQTTFRGVPRTGIVDPNFRTATYHDGEYKYTEVGLVGNEIIEGVKTFANQPVFVSGMIVDSPIKIDYTIAEDDDAVDKLYVDESIGDLTIIGNTPATNTFVDVVTFNLVEPGFYKAEATFIMSGDNEARLSLKRTGAAFDLKGRIVQSYDEVNVRTQTLNVAPLSYELANSNLATSTFNLLPSAQNGRVSIVKIEILTTNTINTLGSLTIGLRNVANNGESVNVSGDSYASLIRYQKLKKLS